MKLRVRAHADIQGNEEADIAAKGSTLITAFRCSKTFLIIKLLEESIRKWEILWSETQKRGPNQEIFFSNGFSKNKSTYSINSNLTHFLNGS